MKNSSKNSYTSGALFPALIAAGMLSSLGACSKSKPAFKVDIEYDASTQHILVTVNRKLKDGERLHARLRYGQPGELDCNRDVTNLPRIDGLQRAIGFEGPMVDDSVFAGFYDTSWVEGDPTPEMLALLDQGFPFIDVCLVTDTEVVAEEEFDPNRALDKTIDNGKADSPDEEVIRSVEAYAEACVAELGEIPFFPKISDGDYETYNCLDSIPVPMTVTQADGRVDMPQEKQTKCDNPQYIYSSCEPNAVDGQTNGPRVTSATNDQGSSWVLLCRKAKDDEGEYNDIAMIGTNPYTGRTCFFQNALFSRTNGLKVSHPGDIKESDASPEVSSSIWKGIHGGIGSGIECGECHSTDAFIHTPWIDGALKANGEQVIPRMGEHDDFALGFNDGPYSLVNRFGQNWTMPKHIKAPEAAACTRCHRVADGRWGREWIDRLVGEDDAWSTITTDEYLKFEHKFWMPPGVQGLDDDTWADSPEGKALKFIQECSDNPTSACQWTDLPTAAITDVGKLPTIDLEGAELALESAKVLGASATSPDCPGGDCASRRCSECHSVSKGALGRWRVLTNRARDTCNLADDPTAMTQSKAMESVNCLRVEPSDPTSVFAAEKLGIYTTGVQYGPFRALFRKAFGDDRWLIPYLQFRARVSMPKGGHPKLSQREYAVLDKWFTQGLPNMGEVIVEPPAPTSCVADHNIAGVNSHLTDMGFDGWAVVNKDNGINMFGCANADPAQCFTSGFTNRNSSWGNNIGTIREVKKLGFRSSFWTRSSPDGRFIGNGGGSDLGSTITDMVTGVDIPIDASYDPGFFPDNSGFIFQGATGGAGICPNSVLTKYNSIEFNEPECITASGINLYQHVATGVGGNDYFVINSQFTSDPGNDIEDPTANFAASATMKFTPMIFDGSNYVPASPVIVDSPFEGDSVLSPSARLVISRLAGADGVSLGYVIRKVNITNNGSSYTVNVSEKLATICNMQGAKAGFSYDERFVVTHHYEEDGTANLFLYDLQSEIVSQITDMPAGQRALFPHFRSDGWIYFTVKDGSDEFAAASDAAVILAQ